MSSGHLPVQRNSSHNAMLYNHPGLIEVCNRNIDHLWDLPDKKTSVKVEHNLNTKSIYMYW